MYMVTSRVQFVHHIYVYKHRKRKDKFKLGMITVKRKGRENGRQESCKIVTSVFRCDCWYGSSFPLCFSFLSAAGFRLLHACIEDKSRANG